MKEQNPSHAVILCACVCVYYLPVLLCFYNVSSVRERKCADFFIYLTKSPIFCAELKGQCGLILTGVLCGGSGLVAAVAHFSLHP